MRPTVIAPRFSCERRAQSSSGTSMVEREYREDSPSRARSRAAGVEKKIRVVPLVSSMAVGSNSSRSASNASLAASSTTSAGNVFNLPTYQFTNLPIYQLPKHVLDPIEQIALFLFLVPRARLELLFREDVRQLLEQPALLLVQLLRRLHLHGREQVALAAAVHV